MSNRIVSTEQRDSAAFEELPRELPRGWNRAPMQTKHHDALIGKARRECEGRYVTLLGCTLFTVLTPQVVVAS